MDIMTVRICWALYCCVNAPNRDISEVLQTDYIFMSVYALPVIRRSVLPAIRGLFYGQLKEPKLFRLLIR